VELAAGSMVNANVRLTRQLGEGAMGAVWVADHLTLATEVAVKFISQQLAREDHQIVARFEQEAAVAAQIKSPHVVQTFDRGVTDDGTPYIVMELLEGESLQDRLDRTGRLTVQQTAQVVAQVARALRKAHELGIVHRDIKPDNVFVTSTEDGFFCKVLDFGIAKQTQLPKLGGLTSPGSLIGTPEYMSPEQVMSSRDVDYRTDLWALAVTAYHCVTGKLPFTADALGPLCVLLMKAEFAPPSKLRPGLPPGTDAWFARALAKEPADRFGDAREMALGFVRLAPREPLGLEDSLLQSLPGLPPSQRPPTSVGLGPGSDGDPLGGFGPGSDGAAPITLPVRGASGGDAAGSSPPPDEPAADAPVGADSATGARASASQPGRAAADGTEADAGSTLRTADLELAVAAADAEQPSGRRSTRGPGTLGSTATSLSTGAAASRGRKLGLAAALAASLVAVGVTVVAVVANQSTPAPNHADQRSQRGDDGLPSMAAGEPTSRAGLLAEAIPLRTGRPGSTSAPSASAPASASAASSSKAPPRPAPAPPSGSRSPRPLPSAAVPRRGDYGF
jgi:serine/threonine-protein kinase